MLEVTIDTPQGNMHIITAYIQPRDSYLYYPGLYKILKSTDPVYIIGDLNARHLILGHANKNIRGELLATLINRRHAQHIGPHFPTFLTHRSSTSPDIILSNHRTFHNTYASPGTILTSSDHNYMKFTISSSPLQIPTKERPSLKRADWDTYRDILSVNTILDEEHPTKEEIETQTQTWITQITHAANSTIPKTKYKTHHTTTTNATRTIALHTTTWNNIIDNMDIEPDAKKL